MDLFSHTISSATVATFSWMVGTLAGLAFSVALVVAIAAAPRLHEHDGKPAPLGRTQRILRFWAPVTCAVIWVAGILLVSSGDVPRYAAYSAMAASAVLGFIMLPLVASAANHIARRSIW